MYYNFNENKLLAGWEIDFIDYFLISAFVTSSLVHKFHPKLREKADKAKLKRLKRDLINKSFSSKASSKKLILLANRIIEEFYEINSQFREEVKMGRLKRDLINKSRTKRPIQVRPLYYKALLKERGGELDTKLQISIYKFIYRFQRIILKFLSFLKNKERYANQVGDFAKKVFYRKLITAIQLLLEYYNITIRYDLRNGVGPELTAVAIITGGATGLVSAWLPLLRIILVPTALFSTFLSRSVVQQLFKIGTFVAHAIEKRRIKKLLKDEEISEQIRKLIIQSQSQFSNADKVKLTDLNWNRNGTIRETAHTLKVFENPPELLLKDLFLDPSNLDPAFKKLFQELGIPEKPISISSLRPRPKAKLVNFSNFVRSIRSIRSEEDLEFPNDSDLLEVENLLKEIKKIKIRND